MGQSNLGCSHDNSRVAIRTAGTVKDGQYTKDIKRLYNSDWSGISGVWQIEQDVED